MDFRPIGVVRSPLKEAGSPPFQSTYSLEEGSIEVFSEFQEGLMSIEGFSHLIILSHLDRAAKDRALTERPLSDGVAYHGIFASRHYNRPNPIGLSYVALRKVENGILYVNGLDLLDGTQILDIKPYVPAFDSIPHAVSGWVSDQHVERIRTTSNIAHQKIIKSGQNFISVDD